MLDAFSGLELSHPKADFDPGRECERLDEGIKT